MTETHQGNTGRSAGAHATRAIGRRLPARRRGRAALVALVALFTFQVAHASTFGVGGTAIPPISIPAAAATPVAVLHQADGKMIVAGTANGPVATTMFAARFTAAGALDATYGRGGIAYIDIPPDLGSMRAGAAILDGNGNLVLAGQGPSIHSWDPVSYVTIIR